MRAAAAGESLLPPRGTRRVIEEFASRPQRALAPNPEISAPTPCEREIMAVVAAGLSIAQIARRFFLGPATVRTQPHRAAL
ncbi:MAG TPA: LuxR C-terminal-related transcriptional regulator [Candidatus Dormibacteraeota bacterium]|nr:LuxR C-terminal-related transcriptional regulator [Candidatus Dormibacteraeota bacterium]